MLFGNCKKYNKLKKNNIFFAFIGQSKRVNITIELVNVIIF